MPGSGAGICGRGRTGPRPLVECLRAERGKAARSGAEKEARLYVGSVLRAGSAGRLCSRPAIELREERARVSRDRGRPWGAASGAGDAASGRPKCEERRWNGFLACDMGREVSCTLCSSAGTLSLSGCDGRLSSEGAHESGRARRRGRCSEAPVEFACPMVRGRPARKTRRRKNSGGGERRTAWKAAGQSGEVRRRQAVMYGAAEPSQLVTGLAGSRRRPPIALSTTLSTVFPFTLPRALCSVRC